MEKKEKAIINPRSVKERKISLPNHKIQCRLRDQFKRQLSLPKVNDILPIYDPMLKAQLSEHKRKGSTGVIFNEEAKEHYCLWDDDYPENPGRLDCILSRCKDLNLFSKCEILKSTNASQEYIQTAHSEELYNILKHSSSLKKIAELEELSNRYDWIYLNSKTFDTCLAAAGCSLEIVKRVIEGHLQNGIALVRPPGHHAMKNDFCGFCYFNNVALAAKYAVEQMGLKRVLIVDWDVHHGQGTQQMFYDDPRVLYFSTHRYEHGTFWPHLRESEYDYIGKGPGIGYNFNIPLNTLGLGNHDFLAYFQQILLPVAYEFAPQLVIISAGYDSALGDPKGCMNITPAFYSHMTSMLMNLADGKVVAVLEGGYCLESLSEGAMHTLRALLGYPCPKLLDPIGAPSESMRESILNAIYVHKPYWKSLSYQDNVDESNASQSNLHTPNIICNHELQHENSEEISQEKIEQLHKLKEETSLSVCQHQVCLSYDSRMEQHVHLMDKSFPERPARTKEIMKRLEEFGLLDRIHQLKSRKVKLEELELVHSSQLIMLILDELPSLSNIDRKRRENDFDSIYFHEKTPEAACLAAGCLLQVVDSVCNGDSQSGLAIIRPPGHHAEEKEPYGFCIFNNVALAARYAHVKHGLEKIMIVDWDIHHGNGIQHIFEANKNVLYVSIHLYKNANFFPYSCDGNSDFVGKGNAKGYNVNIPWNRNGMGDAEYISVFNQIVMPIAYEFAPDLVLVSAGFDAAVNDPLGGCSVTPECFGHLTRLLMTVANGRVILALEGGYNLSSVSYSMTMCAKALLGDPLPSLQSNLVPCPQAVKTIKEVIEIQKEYWSILCFDATFPINSLDDSHDSSKNIFLESQSQFLTPPQSPEQVVDQLLMDRSKSDDGNYDLSNIMQSLRLTPKTETNVPLDSKKYCLLDPDNFLIEQPMDVNVTKIYPITDTDLNVEKQESIKNEITSTTEKISDEQMKTSPLKDNSVEIESNRLQEIEVLSGEELEGAVGGSVDPITQITLGKIVDNSGQELYAVVPLNTCPHLEEVRPIPPDGLNFSDPCQECKSCAENWVCLSCYTVLCGRFVDQHMVIHNLCSNHPMVLSYADLSVWCYPCQSYVDNQILSEAKDSAYLSKFQTLRPC